jgi:Fe-S cluster assembly iron-binding protein IscA
MALDEPRDDDHVLELSGIKLFIDPMSGRYLKGSEIKYEDSPSGAGFTIDNPNEAQFAGSCRSCSQGGCQDDSGEEQDGQH